MKTDYDILSEGQAIFLFCAAHIFLIISGNVEMCSLLNFFVLIHFVVKDNDLKKDLARYKDIY